MTVQQPYLLQHESLGEERLTVVEKGFRVFIHELEAELPLRDFSLVPRPPHPLQDCPVSRRQGGHLEGRVEVEV
jgi:hypothetical protein